MRRRRRSIIIDNALLLSVLLDKNRQNHSLSDISFCIEYICKNYSRILYEAPGKSGLERSIRSIDILADKLVAIFPNKFSICTPSEGELLKTTIRESLNRVSVIHALQKYEQSKGGAPSPHDKTLGYVIRLLLLARQYDADIALWENRLDLFLALFEEANILFSLEEVNDNIHCYTMNPCYFPYLPASTKNRGDFFFKLIVRNKTSTSEIGDRLLAPTISVILFASDPTDASRLRLGKEFREIQEKLQLGKLRDRFVLHQRMAVRPVDISQELLYLRPQIVHFSTHGTTRGALCFENQMGKTHPVKPSALAALFAEFANHVNCVILNACYSEAQARAIAEHINFVIGMSREISDEAAIAFSVGFYQALGADCTIEEAYRLGCAQIKMFNIPEDLTPVLIKKRKGKSKERGHNKEDTH